MIRAKSDQRSKQPWEHDWKPVEPIGNWPEGTKVRKYFMTINGKEIQSIEYKYPVYFARTLKKDG